MNCTLFGCDHNRGRVCLLTRPGDTKLNFRPRLASQGLGRRHDDSRLQPGKTYRHFHLGQDFSLGKGHLRYGFLVHQCAQRNFNQRGRGSSRGFRQPASGVCSLRRRFGCARVTPCSVLPGVDAFALSLIAILALCCLACCIGVWGLPTLLSRRIKRIAQLVLKSRCFLLNRARRSARRLTGGGLGRRCRSRFQHSTFQSNFFYRSLPPACTGITPKQERRSADAVSNSGGSKWRARYFRALCGRNCRELRNTCPVTADSALDSPCVTAICAGMALASQLPDVRY